MDIQKYLPFIIGGLFLVAILYKRKKKGSGDDPDVSGEDIIVGLSHNWGSAKRLTPGGDNAIPEETPGGGVLVTGDDTSVPGGKAETAVREYSGNLYDAKFKVTQKMRGKVYGARYVSALKTTLLLKSRKGSLEQGGMNFEIVRADRPDSGDADNTWTIEQIPGMGPIVNPCFVRGDTGNDIYIAAPRAYDGGHLKRAFRSWNGGIRIAVCKNPKDAMKGPGAWKVIGTAPSYGARKGMATMISVVIPRKAKNAVWGYGDIVQGFVGFKRSDAKKTVAEMLLSGPKHNIFGPTNLKQLAQKFGMGYPVTTEPGHPKHRWPVGPFAISFTEDHADDGDPDRVTISASGFAGFKGEEPKWDSTFLWTARWARQK